jgi:hypothetical protein
MYRYRAVFAAGRAYDKLRQLERSPPYMLFMGNSRTDNSIAPHVVCRSMGLPVHNAFNLGLPGANAIIYQGLVERLLRHGVFGEGGVQVVLLGLDENALQEDNSLGYISFFSDPATLWRTGRYADWLRNHLRLWSYSANLRELREPEKILRLIQATLRPIEPVGGAASLHGGYRAGFGAAQNDAQSNRQEVEAQHAPNPEVLSYLWLSLDALEQKKIHVIIYIPPLRDRPSAFFDPRSGAAPYRRVLEKIEQRGITVLDTQNLRLTPAEFINAGHLNDHGAQRYSALIGQQLSNLKLK